MLDEATAMLDPIGRESVMRTVHRLNDDYGITVVQITHYMEEAATADRVVVMSAAEWLWRARRKRCSVMWRAARCTFGCAAGRRAVPCPHGCGLPDGG